MTATAADSAGSVGGAPPERAFRAGSRSGWRSWKNPSAERDFRHRRIISGDARRQKVGRPLTGEDERRLGLEREPAVRGDRTVHDAAQLSASTDVHLLRTRHGGIRLLA